MKKYMIAFVLTALLTGCSDRNESSISGEKEVVESTNSAESTSVIEEATAPTTEAATEAEQDSDFRILEVEDDGITVLVANNTIQKIEIDCTEILRMAEIYDTDPAELLVIKDYNFDGYDDLFVPATTLIANLPGTYYRFDPTVNFSPFEKWDELNKIGQLMDVDADNQVLNLAVRISAAEHETTVYRWESGRLVPVSRTHYYVGNEDDQYYIDHFEYDENGEEILVKQESGAINEDGNKVVSEASGR